MLIFIIILTLIFAVILLININLEMNSLSKSIENLTLEIKKHYGIK
jgi:hypothetical protein